MENYIDLTTTPGSGVEMRFSVLGPVTVSDEAAAVGIGGPKQRAVLAMLIANAGSQVGVDTIIEAVWGDETPGNARRNVQTYVSNLRSVLRELIAKDSHGWRLTVERSEIDALTFEDLYESARDAVEANPERVSVALREALALWRGHPYADIEAHGALDSEIARLTELRTAAQAARIEADLATGRDADLVGEIEALLAENPYSERFRAQHMLALYRAGRQQEALRSCGEMRSILLEELGVEPTPELQQLELRILEQAEDLHAAPTKAVTTRAIVVVDPGDPIAIGRLHVDDRDALLDRTADAVRSAIASEAGADVQSAGATTYVVVESPAAAARVAEQLASGVGGADLHLAVDWGDVVLDDGGAHGAPVSRAAVMAAVGNPGQILLSSDAQQAIGSDPDAGGFRFQTLGDHDLQGIDEHVLVYQLVIDGQPSYPQLQLHRLPPPIPGGTAQSVPGYELRAPFGPGSVGMLHRAFQPSVGREMLVEVIGPDVSSRADFVRNFEADAQRLALLDHRNLASVVDYWRRPEGAFLVYRLPRGGTVADHDDVDAKRVVRDIGAALSYAHSFGMVHGSVRPDRILLDVAGNASLIGFPIAGTRPPGSARFPAYIAPELLAGEPPTVATDVYALGVLAHELRTGAVDSDARVESDDPAISRAMSDDSADRQSSVAELIRDLTGAETDDPDTRFTAARNPYKGLAAFHERDARDFFGRAAVVDELVQALARSRLLAVVGPSGAGKSSVARAGLVPSLRAGSLPGSETWMVTDLLPGAHPFLELQRAIERVAVDLPIGLTEGLAARTPDALRDATRVIPDQAELVVLVDQFEELFTLTDERERVAFLDLIVTAVEQSHARFVLTMRADFLDRPLRYSGFGELFRQSAVMLRAPSREELAEAIARPAAQVGVTVDAVLVERMIADGHDQPGALPLLQHTLGELFERRTTDRITADSFEAVGGLSGSLAQRAEAIYTAMEAPERHGVAQGFLRLVAVLDDGPPTRRRVRLTDLGDLISAEVLEPFVRARLLVHDNDPGTRTPTVEVSHEALMINWPRLGGWIDAAREDLTLSRRLDDAVAEWESNDRADAHLLTGGRLAQHETWTESTSLAVAPTASEYLELSRAHDDADRSRRRRIRNLVLTAFVGAAVIAGIFALVAARNANKADEQADLARAEALAASALAVLEEDPELAVLLGVEAIETAPGSSQASIALNEAIQSHRTIFRFDQPPGEQLFTLGSLSPDGGLLAVALDRKLQVWDVDSHSGPLWEAEALHSPDRVESYDGAFFTSDGSYVVAELGSSSPEEDEAEAAAGEGGEESDEAETCDEDRFRLFDARSGELVDEVSFTGTSGFLSGLAQTGPFLDVERPLLRWDECSETDEPRDLVAVDLLTGEQSILATAATAPDRFTGVPTMSEDGNRLATITDETVIVSEGGNPIFELETEVEGMSTLSSSGELLVASTNPLELWDVDDQTKLREFQGEFTMAWISADESFVYGATFDGRTLVYDLATGELVFELRGHAGRVIELQMSEDESRLATVSADFTARVWDIGSEWVPTTGPEGFDPAFGELEADFMRGNSHAAVDDIAAARFGSTGGTLAFETAVYETVSGEPIGTYDGIVIAAAGDGQRVAVQRTGAPVDLDAEQAGELDADRGFTPIVGIEIADRSTGETLVDLDGLCDWYFQPISEREYGIVRTESCTTDRPWREFSFTGAFSPDDSLFAMIGQSGRTAVWDTSSGELLWSTGEGDEEIGPGGEGEVEFSPDGSLLLTSTGPDFQAWRTDTWELDAEFGFERGPSQMEFRPDGGELVFTHIDIVVVETETWTEASRLVGHQSLVHDMALDPTGRFVATAGLDNTSWVWDLETGEAVHRFTFPALDQGLRNVEWVDEQTLLLGSQPGAVLMTLDPVVLAESARDRLTRTFITEECATYDIDSCPVSETAA